MGEVLLNEEVGIINSQEVALEIVPKFPELLHPRGVVVPPLSLLEEDELIKVSVLGIRDHSPIDDLHGAGRRAVSFFEIEAKRGFVDPGLKSAWLEVCRLNNLFDRFVNKNHIQEIKREDLILFFREYYTAAEKYERVLRPICEEKAKAIGDPIENRNPTPLEDSLRFSQEIVRIAPMQIDLLTQRLRLDILSLSSFVEGLRQSLNQYIDKRDINLEVEGYQDRKISLHSLLVHRAVAECVANTHSSKLRNKLEKININLSFRIDGEELLVVLKDNAGGFPVDRLDLLQPSAKHAVVPGQAPRPKVMDLGETSKQRGGVGMTELYYIMRAHGGSAEIKSPVDNGTQITLRFPFACRWQSEDE